WWLRRACSSFLAGTCGGFAGPWSARPWRGNRPWASRIIVDHHRKAIKQRARSPASCFTGHPMPHRVLSRALPYSKAIWQMLWTRHGAVAGRALGHPLRRGKERTRDRVVGGCEPIVEHPHEAIGAPDPVLVDQTRQTVAHRPVAPAARAAQGAGVE